MRKKQVFSVLLATSMVASMFAGCGGGDEPADVETLPTTAATTDDGEATQAPEATVAPTEIKEFTAFFAVPGSEINDDNEIKQLIAEKTGAKVKEVWLTGQTDKEAIGTFIAGEEYPDFIEGGGGQPMLYDAGALVALDDYIEKYPNIKALFSEQDWDKLRQDDGHIYWIPQFGTTKNAEKVCTHNDEAFWIQTRVLKWANYPKVETMDEYFQLIEDYYAANPTMQDGTAIIPYTILCEDWRYFCLENAPQFLDGYPNDGSVIVDVNTKKIVDYNTTPTAKRYFAKLNEEYKKNIVDPESFTQTYDEYIAKLSTGRVLGMIDQWWNFAYQVNDSLKQQGLDKQGCNYVPLPITIEKGIKNQWHNSGAVLNVSSGLALTVSCKEPDAAMKFINDVLAQDIHDMRFWGIKDVDYMVDENGVYYRTEEQRMQAADTVYKASHLCTYSYLPQYSGTSDDGINANKPDGQPNEFYDSLDATVQECFKAYGAQTYVDMLGSSEAPGPWYPMWSYSNGITTDTEGGTSWLRMGEIKHQYLPKIVMADDFEAGWVEYMEAYEGTNPQAFLDEMQVELDKRIEAAAKFN